MASCLFVVFLFGTIIGSFLNVIIFRLNSGKTILGRSACFSCGEKLRWFELIPVLSFVFLKGKCRHCLSKVSLQYPLVELITGAIFALVFLYFSPDTPLTPFSSDFFSFSLHLILWSALIVIFFYDLRHKIIPDACSLIFFILALCITVFSTLEGGMSVLWNHLLAGAILGGFFFLLWFLSRGRWMGFGDVKLALGIGMYLGLAQGLSAFAYAFWIGAGYSVVRIVLARVSRVGTNQLSSSAEPLTMKSEIPFAPFLIMGTFLALWFQSDVFYLNLFF